MRQLTRLIEAALFSADRPLSLGELSVLDREADKSEVQACLEELKDTYDSGGHGVQLTEVAEGYQLLTRREFAEAIVEARVVTRPRKPSPAAMETLAIIAYRQPVGRAEIEEIRGVAADGVLRSLQERGLIAPVGRGEGLGRPILYGTTSEFLELLGIKSIEELPRLEELSIALTPPKALGEEEPEEEDLDLFPEDAIDEDEMAVSSSEAELDAPGDKDEPIESSAEMTSDDEPDGPTVDDDDADASEEEEEAVHSARVSDG